MKHLFSRLHLPVESRMPAFAGATEWLNTKPLTPTDLQGKVVVVDFWTYTCINWLRTLPYVRAWAETYGDHGLVVIGVHTPEFSIEHDIDNVRRAARTWTLGTRSRSTTTTPFGTRSPTNTGRRSTLRMRKAASGTITSARAKRNGPSRSFGSCSRTPATLIFPVEPARDRGARYRAPRRLAQRGFARNVRRLRPVRRPRLAGRRRIRRAARLHGAVAACTLNEWALAGNWTVRHEDAVSNEAHGRIAYRFHARDLHVILAPPALASARFRVLLDGQAPGDAHGLDVDEQGNGVVTEPRLYQLIRQGGHVTDRQCEIEFLDPGAAALCFTFG